MYDDDNVGQPEISFVPWARHFNCVSSMSKFKPNASNFKWLDRWQQQLDWNKEYK